MKTFKLIGLTILILIAAAALLGLTALLLIPDVML